MIVLLKVLSPFAIILIVGCTQSPPPAATTQSSAEGAGLRSSPVENSPKFDEEFTKPHRLTAKHLPNPVWIHPKVISGGLPEGAEAFQELKDLGIKTIISVDGMTPDVQAASKFGLRYVHLPHGYDGVPAQRAKQLAKAVRDLDGPVYIHCHHGKHRSPAAASVACVSAGLIPPKMGLQVLEIAGTNPNYRGLFESARTAHPLDDALLDELHVDFHEQVPVPPTAQAMVQIGHAFEHLKLIEESGWRTPEVHPDLVPAHEALMLREYYTELLRTEEVRQQPERFLQLLQASEEEAHKLEDELKKIAATPNTVIPRESLSRITAAIAHDCKQCHQEFRDVPLNEK